MLLFCAFFWICLLVHTDYTSHVHDTTPCRSVCTSCLYRFPQCMTPDPCILLKKLPASMSFCTDRCFCHEHSCNDTFGTLCCDLPFAKHCHQVSAGFHPPHAHTEKMPLLSKFADKNVCSPHNISPSFFLEKHCKTPIPLWHVMVFHSRVIFATVAILCSSDIGLFSACLASVCLKLFDIFKIWRNPQ